MTAHETLLRAVDRLSPVLDHGTGGISTLLRRPRFLRGPYADAPFDAPALRTRRLYLRPHRFSSADLDVWHRLQSTPAVVRHLSWEVRSRRASRTHLKNRTRHTRLWQSDDFLALAVELDGVLIGDVSLQLRAVGRDIRTVEIGWVIDPEHGGKGYATEAAAALLMAVFERFDARIVLAVIDPANTRSIALAHRLGFVETHRDGSSVLLSLSERGYLDLLARSPAIRDLLRSTGDASAVSSHHKTAIR